MKIFAKAEKSKICWFLLIISAFFFLLRIPSFIEPYWYGDEGIYQVIGMGLRNGRLLYRDIWDNKPPLLYVLYALYNSDQFTIRLVSALFGIGSIIVFYFLAQNLFKKHIAYSVTSVYAFLFSLPLFEGNIANAENFMLFPIILSALFIYKASELEPPKTTIKSFSLSYILHTKYHILLFSAGLILSFAFLFKIVAIFDFIAFFLFLFFVHHPKNFSKKNISRIVEYSTYSIKTFLQLLLGFFIPIFITVLFFFFQGALPDFLHAAFIQNVGYVGYGNTLFFTQGLLVIKLILLSGVCFFLFLKRAHIPKILLFILLWLSFSVFNAFFSARPYTHYALVLLPSFCLFLGATFSNRLKTLSKAEQKRQKILLTLLIVLIILVYKNFWLYGKNISYYQNFFLFLTNKKSVTMYRSFFDSKTPRDYELSALIKPKKDTLFIWGNNAQVYTLLGALQPGRYTVAYHINSSLQTLKETELALSKIKPKYIIIMPDVGIFPYSLSGYNQIYKIRDVSIYERSF